MNKEQIINLLKDDFEECKVIKAYINNGVFD